MASQFSTYARFYNLLYKDKDYKGESEYIHALIQRFAESSPAKVSVLDLACGTGKHLFELQKIGYAELAGSDISSEMINVAKASSIEAALPVTFHNYSFQESDRISQTFDVVLSMFSAVNYLVNYEDQSKTFSNVNKLLKEGGIFIFDYWNGNAVVRDYSPVKVLRKKDGDSEILRISETNIDTVEQHVQVKFTCLFFEGGEKAEEFSEVHDLHYYHFSEMKNLLAQHGFEVQHVSPFRKIDEAINPHEWNVSIVAKKVKDVS